MQWKKKQLEPKRLSSENLENRSERMNEIAGDICLKDVSMLADKGKLLQQARLKLHESGYVYSKGKLRSKILNPEVTKHDKPRRERIDKKEHKHRIESLQDEMKDINKHVTVKERRIEQAQAAKNFKLCDQLSDEITNWIQGYGLYYIKKKDQSIILLEKSQIQYKNQIQKKK